MNRPEYNHATGNRIRYANSPAFDMTGYPFQYGNGPDDDRSNPQIWDQNTGLRIGQSVSVSMPVGSQVPQEVSVTTVAYEGYDTPPVVRVPAGGTIGSIRQQPAVRNRLNLSNDVVASVDNVPQGDNFVPTAGSVVVFRERNKKRGI